MSGCARRRWGEGTACTRPADTPAAKEMAARLAAMQAERQKQDAAWGGPVQQQQTAAEKQTSSLARTNGS